MITYATVCSTEMPVSGFGTDIGIFLMKTRMNKKEISMIKKIAAVMLSVCMSTAMAAGVQAADFTSGEETLGEPLLTAAKMIRQVTSVKLQMIL